ncbi:hypothetical protein AE09_01444 [Klebsiella pneumoniae BWH 46]|nr:hypothetical protein AE09_01444 [Klebsiella pneumoniae BWH 46]
MSAHNVYYVKCNVVLNNVIFDSCLFPHQHYDRHSFHARECCAIRQNDTLFFSCQGLERDSGLYAGTQAHAALLKQMLLAARQTVALVDGSKLGRTGVARIGGLGELDCLVTERFVDPLLEKEMTWHNVSLQIA